jgi:carboxyl-terminal processing protease
MPRRNLYLLFAAAAISLVCYHRADSASRSRYGRMSETLRRALDQIEKHYVEKVDARGVFDAALAGMVDSLGDPYSKYITEKELPHFKEDLAQEFGGIGINVMLDEERRTLKVAGALPGTPADEAGLLPGDLILEVDGTDIQGMDMEAATALIKGKPGTIVRLKVLSEGQEEPREHAIRRAEIKVPSVLGDRYRSDGNWAFLLEAEPGIAYIRIAKFGDKTVGELNAVLTQLKKQGMNGLVLDLRNNPGGLLQSAVEVCDLFVDEGRIVSIRGRPGSPGDLDMEVFEARTPGTFCDFPIVVLINGYSASASEIVAACLQDHGRAVVVGERSWGKGSVQNVVALDGDRTALKLTIATYWRPSGKNIHRLPSSKEDDDWGVRPDAGHEVKLEVEALTKMHQHRRQRDIYRKSGTVPALNLDLDPQLKKALEALKKAADKAPSQPDAA